MFRKSKTKELRKRYIELAAMLKEKKSGSILNLEQIKRKFGLQEGVKAARVEEYIDMLEGAGLIKYTPGGKRWKYDPDAEWELFKVNV